jgi:hypothetical protein
VAGPVGVGGVGEADAELEPAADGGDRLIVVDLPPARGPIGAPERPADRPAAEAERADDDSGWPEAALHDSGDHVNAGQARTLAAIIEVRPFGATATSQIAPSSAPATLGRVSKRDADRALELLLEHGVNHIERQIALGADGALEAAGESREEGLVRFIGVTRPGSPWRRWQRSLGRFPFDSALCPYNHVQMQDARHAETFETLGGALRGAQRRAADDQVAFKRGAGTAARRPRRPGTSRCATRTTSISLRTGCSAGRESSC